MGSTRSGKSTLGISKYIHHLGLGRFKCVIIIPEWSVRPDDPVYLSWNIPYITFSKSNSADDQVRMLEGYDVIVMDECQFNDHLIEVVIRLLNLGKRMYLSGLDGDFLGNPIGDTLDLIPYCDNIIKKRAECIDCLSEGRSIINPSVRTIRVDNNITAPIIEIGGLKTFKPVCREHAGIIHIPQPRDRMIKLLNRVQYLLESNPELAPLVSERLNI